MDTGHQSIARAEHPPVGAEMVQRRRDRSGFFGKMLVNHTDKYTSTKRIVPVWELLFQAPQYQRFRGAQWGVSSLLP
jgi:hypothetical protein